MHETAAKVVRIEALALAELAARIEGAMAEDFGRALEMLFVSTGRVVVTGMGKSGIIARKIAATLASTGTPALFLHPAEAMHGDLGMLVKGDIVIALSASGETEELVRLLPLLKRIAAPLISMTCDCLYPRGRVSTLAEAAEIALDCSIAEEACGLGLAPTASTTAMLALGDALAVSLSIKRGFKEGDFADLHPGGKLGKKLMRISQVMHAGEALPKVAPGTRMHEVIHEMSSKRLGMTTVMDGHRLLGVISDGDLRRLLQARDKEALDLTAGEVMTQLPQTITQHELATAALRRMEEQKITSLVVVDGDRAVGVVHLHDLWGTELV
ncbi:MAG: KpsF/GutQ family sugar-phosphate isomerase [Acidobacteriaceae bacterium]